MEEPRASTRRARLSRTVGGLLRHGSLRPRPAVEAMWQFTVVTCARFDDPAAACDVAPRLAALEVDGWRTYRPGPAPIPCAESPCTVGVRRVVELSAVPSPEAA